MGEDRAPDVMAIVMVRGKQPERIRITKVTLRKLIQMLTVISSSRMADPDDENVRVLLYIYTGPG